jgi:predicted RNase H-like nuclease (RuvC/YqgF family)
MKLQDLAAPQQTKQVAKVFESYFGAQINFENIPKTQAKQMLGRIRSLVREHRRTPEFHQSEKNPAYLKLVMMEQALTARIGEMAPAANPAQQAALATAQQQQKKKQMQDQIKANQDQIKALQQENSQLQQQMNMPTAMESKIARRLREASEVQQAQVVLASQDMVDQVQKMSEQISAMQFKDLPALVDSIKNEVGVDQAMQFNGDASAALSGLLQNLQGAKQQLEAALGVVTGQAPVVPGEDMGAAPDMGAELPAELPAPGEEEISVDATEIEPEAEPAASTLGRGRR